MRDWAARGRALRLPTLGSALGSQGRGLDVFCIDTGPPPDKPDASSVVVLHGFPTSTLDFHRVLDRLARDHRVVLHDHPGFGLSAKPADASYSLIEQAEVALLVWRALGVRGAHLLAHDYGTSIATEILARRHRGLWPAHAPGLRSVTFTNGSLLLELAHLRLAQRIARSRLGPLFGRLVPEGYFRRVIRRLWADPARCDRADLDAMWHGIRYRDGHLRTHQISQYLHERVRFRSRWIAPLGHLDLPSHVLWARRDPVAVAAIGERIAEILATVEPKPRVTWLDDAGHFPMLEQPDAFADAVLAFLARVDAA